MGLDIYLYRYDDYKSTKEKEDKYNEFSEELWESAGEYDNIPETIKSEINRKCDEYAKLLGVDRWGEDTVTKEKIEFGSERFPDHYFKVGYFRSSYNEGGIERILRNLGLPTMADVFDHGSDDYCFQPDWEKSLQNVTLLIQSFKEKGAYRVEAHSANMFGPDRGPKDPAKAIEIFLNEMETHKGDYGYSNINGDFYFNEPRKVLAIIPGTQTLLGERQCVYVVTESDNTWYINALEIVKETIEYVLSQENKEQYYLHWSG